VLVHKNDPFTEKIGSTWEAQRGKREVLDHFVTVRGLQGAVILQARFEDEGCCEHITWECDVGTITSPAVGTDKCTANVSRAGTTEGNLDVGQRIEVRITCDGMMIWKGIVWVVWANVRLAVPENGTPAIRSTNAVGVPGAGRRLKLSAEANQQKDIGFVADITPKSMFEHGADIPRLDRFTVGQLQKSVPDGDKRHIVERNAVLKGGVMNVFDLSRQVRARTMNPALYTEAQLPKSGNFWKVFSQNPQASAVNVNYPESADPKQLQAAAIDSENTIGNDDPTVNDNERSPYSQTPEKQGVLRQTDAPDQALPHALGTNGNTFEVRLQFREFVRFFHLGKWYLISNPADNAGLWRVHLRFVKVNGKWENNATTPSDFGQNNNGFEGLTHHFCHAARSGTGVRGTEGREYELHNKVPTHVARPVPRRIGSGNGSGRIFPGGRCVDGVEQR